MALEKSNVVTNKRKKIHWYFFDEKKIKITKFRTFRTECALYHVCVCVCLFVRCGHTYQPDSLIIISKKKDYFRERKIKEKSKNKLFFDHQQVKTTSSMKLKEEIFVLYLWFSCCFCCVFGKSKMKEKFSSD